MYLFKIIIITALYLLMFPIQAAVDAKIKKIYRYKNAVILNKGSVDGFVKGRRICLYVRRKKITCAKIISSRKNRSAARLKPGIAQAIRPNAVVVKLMYAERVVKEASEQSVETKIESDFSLLLEPSFRYFVSDSDKSGSSQLSFKVEPKFSFSKKNKGQKLSAHVFYRYDDVDKNRSHFDVREALLNFDVDEWSIKVGIGKIFWGVLETENIIDVINQVDFVEGVDGKEKLGQPLLGTTYLSDSINFEFYLLPYFREMVFPDNNSRLASPIAIASKKSTFESRRKEKHLDYAARVSGSVSNLDYSVIFFHGTSRVPELQLDIDDAGTPLEPKLVPHYPLTWHYGLSLQYIYEEVLLKLEAAIRREDSKNHNLLGVGAEYNFYSIFSKADLGTIMEYYFDDRRKKSTRIYQNDLVGGLRLTLNDANSTEFTVGMIHDFDYQSQLGLLEVSTGSQGRYLTKLKYRGVFGSKQKDQIIYNLRKSSYVELSIGIYF